MKLFFSKKGSPSALFKAQFSVRVHQTSITEICIRLTQRATRNTNIQTLMRTIPMINDHTLQTNSLFGPYCFSLASAPSGVAHISLSGLALPASSVHGHTVNCAVSSELFTRLQFHSNFAQLAITLVIPSQH
jgi:hypothetical protein